MKRMIDRVTSDKITKLQPNEIFVFGSNEAGIHGAGAAKTALQWGAKYGKGCGQYGQTYAIPTKDRNIKTLSLGLISVYVYGFIMQARADLDNIYLVTEIGCGLAGYSPREVAPLFNAAIYAPNIRLPRRFWQELGYCCYGNLINEE